MKDSTAVIAYSPKKAAELCRSLAPHADDGHRERRAAFGETRSAAPDLHRGSRIVLARNAATDPFPTGIEESEIEIVTEHRTLARKSATVGRAGRRAVRVSTREVSRICREANRRGNLR